MIVLIAEQVIFLQEGFSPIYDSSNSELAAYHYFPILETL